MSPQSLRNIAFDAPPGRELVFGVVSDTHLPRFGTALPSALVRGLVKAQVQAILHCGDLTKRIAIELLEEIAPVIAVAGNNEGKELRKELGDRVLLFNPGSPTDKRINPVFSYGIIRIDGKRIRAAHRWYLSRK
jgi:uncharacterized protein